MEILSSIVVKLGEYTIEPIGRQLSYVCFIRHNIQTLQSRVEMLKDTKEYVVHKVDEATRNAENIESRVHNWLNRVDSIVEKSETLLNNQAQQGRLCFNLVQRHQLSRKAIKLADEILEIKNEESFDRVSNRVALSEVESSKAKTSNFHNFESRKPTIEKIISALMDDNAHKIGVYGMGGVGKTMLVKEISKIVMEKKLFDEVVTLTISQTPNLKKIQEQLGDKLGLTFEQKTEEGRALKLEKRLRLKQRILVVIDDVWKQIDLGTIGIPSIEDHTGCKILFTSRDNSVLLNDMRTDKNFEIKVLQEDETWNLFKETAGEIVESPDFKSVAIKIVKECAHLPIAIITIAKALRNKHLSIWKDALDQLRNPVDVNIRGMNETVYSSLKLSYEQLDSEEAKLLFLLCSMFPEDDEIEVEGLHVYAMGMGFLHGVETVAQARHRITKLVDDLISSSLLLEELVDWGLCVKMHDLIRDVAILISSKDDDIRTLSYSKGLEESWPEKKISGDHTVVYLNVEGLRNPPQKLNLPKVQILFLCGPLLDGHELSKTFFEETKELKILEVFYMEFSPERMQLLYSFANLQSLNLSWCELRNIDFIGELNRLEFLSIEGYDIIQIPTTMNKLTELKVLNLSQCYQLKIIPPNILSNLRKLEELYLGTFDGWEREKSNDGRNASLLELGYLSDLCVLELWIQDENFIPKQLFSKLLNLEKFSISIGCEPLTNFRTNKIHKVLCLKMETGSEKDDGIKMLLKRSEELHLIGSANARVLPFELNKNGYNSHLKRLYIYDNSQLQHFINYEQNKLPLQKMLSNLEILDLRNLENLESIFHGDHVRESHFNKLKEIKLLSCNKLESLFFDSILNDILHLEKIKITRCDMMKAIIVTGRAKPTEKIEFTNLRFLKLNDLPRLESFFSKVEKLEQLCSDHHSEPDETSKFSNDDSFFNEWISLPNLEELKIKGAHNLKMIFHNILVPHSFSKLVSLKISKCDKLEKVFPSNIMARLTCLEILRIESCNLLEGVFEVQERNATKKDVDLLPSLRHLDLIELPNLQYIWEKNACELLNAKNIEILDIRQCPKLKREYPIKVLHHLQELGIDLSELKEILRKEKSTQMLEVDQLKTSKADIIQLRHGLHLFSRLKNLKLYGSLHEYRCTQLPTEIVQILHNLEEFEVRQTFFEEFPIERWDNAEEWQNERYKLSTLNLCELPKLRHLWNGDLQKNSSIFQNLMELKVSSCGVLNLSVPSSMSFRNLRWLTVEKCHKLTYLLNPSVARSMVQLINLEIEGCKRMTTIIAGGVEEENDEILFKKLRWIDLIDLPKLTGFHSGKDTTMFPCLCNIDITNCPEMRVFSLGIVRTPHLPTKNIKVYDLATKKWCPILKDSREIIVEDINVAIRQVWEDHYNTNLQYLFEEQNFEENQCDP